MITNRHIDTTMIENYHQDGHKLSAHTDAHRRTELVIVQDLKKKWKKILRVHISKKDESKKPEDRLSK